MLPYDQLKSLISDVFYSSFYGVNYHFAAEGVQYQNATVPPSAMQHFWSLAWRSSSMSLALIIICAVIGRRRFRRALTIGVIAMIPWSPSPPRGDLQRPILGGLLLAADPRLGARRRSPDRAERR